MRPILRIGLYLVLGVLWPIAFILGLFAIILIRETANAIAEVSAAGQWSPTQTWLALGFVLVGIVGALLARGLVLLTDEPLKLLRNFSASELVELRDHPRSKRYSLFLPPFKITNKVGFRREPVATSLFEVVFMDRREELEALLFEGFQRHGKLIGIGRPREHLGAGRVLATDDTWQELIADLLPRAQWVILIPSTNEGTLWEVELLKRENHLANTVVILPQQTIIEGEKGGWLKPNTQSKIDLSDWRQDAEEALARAGYVFHSLNENAWALVFDDDGVQRRAQEFRVENMTPFWVFMAELEATRQPTG